MLHTKSSQRPLFTANRSLVVHAHTATENNERIETKKYEKAKSTNPIWNLCVLDKRSVSFSQPFFFFRK